MRLKASQMLARERERKDRKREKRNPLIIRDTGLIAALDREADAGEPSSTSGDPESEPMFDSMVDRKG
jgi:hypothetical protein